MIDTHCHLTFGKLSGELPEVLQRAREAGVTAMVNPGTDVAQSRAAVELAEREKDVSAAVGIHPQDVGGLTDATFSEIVTLARHPNVVAIGEVGLERSDRAPALGEQEHWLERFVVLARGVRKPVIFHVRDAHAEFCAFLDRVWVPAPRSPAVAGRSGAAHCFSGGVAEAQAYVGRGLFLGVTGIVTFPNAEPLREALRAVSLENLVLETDAPFLAPQSHRGQRNEPAYVREVAAALASLYDVSMEEVEQVTDENARRLFGLAGSSRLSRLRPSGFAGQAE